jgi:hypothetical protein
MNRQEKLLQIWKQKHQAIIINGHGTLSNPKNLQTVPNNVVLLFLAKPGTCMNIPSGLGIQNKFFTSKNKFENFLKGGASSDTQYHHVANILSRTHLPGNKYPNMTVSLVPNKMYPTMGYIKKVPTRRSTSVPRFLETNGPIRPESYTLSKLLKGRKGVVVVSACRHNPNQNKTVFNIPVNFKNTSRLLVPRKSKYSNIILKTPYFKSRPGVLHLKMVEAKPFTKKVKNPPQRTMYFKKLSQMVYHSGDTKKSFRKLMALLPANMSVVQKKKFEMLQKHFKSGPTDVRIHRSGLITPKNT